MTRILSVMENNEDIGSKFRVYVTGGGCSGFQYGFKFDSETAFDDDVIEFENFSVLLDSISNVAPENIMRTVTEFTALKIQEFYKYCDSPDQVIFHGGGTKNIYLMKIIQSKIDTNVRTTDDVISSKFVEAAAFAYLAYKNQGIIFKPKL